MTNDRIEILRDKGSRAWPTAVTDIRFYGGRFIDVSSSLTMTLLLLAQQVRVPKMSSNLLDNTSFSANSLRNYATLISFLPWSTHIFRAG